MLDRDLDAFLAGKRRIGRRIGVDAQQRERLRAGGAHRPTKLRIAVAPKPPGAASANSSGIGSRWPKLVLWMRMVSLPWIEVR